MAALVVVTMGVFSSCKDYDDDINANTALINKLQEQVNLLETAAAKAQETADKAVQAAKDAQDTADAAAIAASNAQDAADRAQLTAEAAQSAADAAAALAKSEAAQAKADALDSLYKYARDLQNEINLKVDQTEFDQKIKALNEKDGELQDAIDRLAGQLGDLTTLVNTNHTAVNARIDSVIRNFVTKGDLEVAIAGLDLKIQAQVKDSMNALRVLINKNAEDISANALDIVYLYQITEQIKANYVTIQALDDRLANYVTSATLKDSLSNLRSAITTAYEIAIANATRPLIDQLATIAPMVAQHDADITTLKTAMQNAEDAISTLNNITIPAINQDIQDLKDGKADKSVVDALGEKVQTNIDNIAELFGRMAAVETEAAKIAGILTQLGTINGQIASLQGTASDHEGRIGALETAKGQLEQQLRDLGQRVGIAESNIATLQGQMSTLLDTTIPAINKAIKDLGDKVAVFIEFTNKNITSLVSKPSYWTYGFPTIEATIVREQNVYDFEGEGVKGKTVSEYSEEATAIGEDGYAFELSAKYWVNPSTVTEEFLKNNYTYWFDEVAAKNYITRGNEDELKAGFKDVRFDSYKDGVLTVKFNFDKGANVNNALTHYDEDFGLTPTYAWTTTIALQATRINTEDENKANLDDNRVVTSDYAIVVPTYLDNLLLGNNKYESTGHDGEGNHKWHLNTTYAGAANDDAKGLYSFEISRDDAAEVIDFNDYIDVHYNDCDEVWSNDEAQEKGFEFEYTLLTNEDVWNLDGSNISIKEGQNVAGNTGEDKAAIVRVELIANGNTYAYGYVTVLMENSSLDLEIETELTLNCEYDEQGNELPFTASYSWSDLMDKIENGLGQDIDWTLCDFVPANPTAAAPNAGPYTKFDEKNSTTASTTLKGAIQHVDDNLVWQFTNDEVRSAFYKNGKPKNTTNYTAWIRIVPNDKGILQGFAQINIKVVITKVTYPEGYSGKDDRIYRYWFKQFTALIQTDPELRQEIHANVETVGQPGNTTNPFDLSEAQLMNTIEANDEFVIRVSDAFYNKLHDIKNAFVIEPVEGFKFSLDPAKNFLYGTLYFDATKYYVYKRADEGKNINEVTMTDLQKANTFAIGASGAKYLLFLMNANSNTLMAVKENDAHEIYVSTANAQDVVKIYSTYNRQAGFFGRQDPTHDYARDLLNHTSHLQLGAGETFTTHMLLNNTEYCLPVAITGNQFDIRWLRPITGKLNENKEVIDAKDGGAVINLGELVTFEDWRYSESSTDYEFYVNWNAKKEKWESKNFEYFNYYGVKTINPNLELAQTDINGDWDLLSHFDGVVFDWIKYEPAAGEEILPFADEADFIEKMGYILYQNNGLNVSTFKVKLPVTIEYDWGYTAAVDIVITIVKTEGQPISSRRK